MLERDFQASTIRLITDRLPGVLVLKNDSGYRQGIPDFTIFYGCAWAFLEFKASKNSPVQPNQEYYIDYAIEHAFGAFIFPENRDEVLFHMEKYFRSQDRI